MSRVRVVFDHGDVVEYELRDHRARRSGQHEDDLELRALVGLAWGHRGKPDFREHIEAITDWHDRRHIRAYERRRRSHAAVLQVLRETKPQQEGGRRA